MEILQERVPFAGLYKRAGRLCSSGGALALPPMKPLLALLTALASALAADQPTDWSQAKDEWGKEYAESRAICRRLIATPLPAADRPSAQAARALKGCSSEALYYGIGMKADPAKARKCAYVEMAAGGETEPFTGRMMLMTVYANGVGAARDLDVAAHLACGIEGAPAEIDGRVRHLAALKKSGKSGGDFSYCDDITSGLAMGYCAQHEADAKSAARDAKLAALSAGWSAVDRQAFERLRKAHAAFVDAHSSGEIDLSGTARAAISIGEDERLRDEYLALLQRLQSGRGTAATHAQFVAADAALNRAYRRFLAANPASDQPGVVTPSGIRETQRAWLAYRDAFLAFAAVRFPAVSRDTLATWLIETRTAMFARPE